MTTDTVQHGHKLPECENRPHAVYLASGSPRRRELLSRLGYDVRILPSAIDETPHAQETAENYVRRMAVEKNRAARVLWQQSHDGAPDLPIISADTSVVWQGRILGKPESAEHACAMLRQLSGQTHEVLSAVCVFWRGAEYGCVQRSEVDFAALSDDEIRAYVATGEPLDKAGAYGIQGLGGLLVSALRGSFTGVMGLPVRETVQLLHQAGWVTPLHGMQKTHQEE